MGTLHLCCRPGSCGRGVVCQSEVTFVIADVPFLSPLSAVFLCPICLFSPGTSGTGCVSSLACADVHRAAFLPQCDHFLIPHLHFSAIVFSSPVQQVSGDLFLSSAHNSRRCCAFSVIAVMRIPVVYWNRPLIKRPGMRVFTCAQVPPGMTVILPETETRKSLSAAH